MGLVFWFSNAPLVPLLGAGVIVGVGTLGGIFDVTAPCDLCCKDGDCGFLLNCGTLFVVLRYERRVAKCFSKGMFFLRRQIH